MRAVIENQNGTLAINGEVYATPQDITIDGEDYHFSYVADELIMAEAIGVPTATVETLKPQLTQSPDLSYWALNVSDAGVVSAQKEL